MIWPLEGEYEALSPTLGRVIRFDDEEIIAECERMAAEAQGTAWSAGQSIYRQAPFCFDLRRLRCADADYLLETYMMSRALGVPVAATLDEVPALYADAALVIQHELGHIEKARSANG